MKNNGNSTKMIANFVTVNQVAYAVSHRRIIKECVCLLLFFFNDRKN